MASVVLTMKHHVRPLSLLVLLRSRAPGEDWVRTELANRAQITRKTASDPGGFFLETTVTLRTDDLRISEIRELITPARLTHERPLSDVAAQTVSGARGALQKILSGSDDRLAVVIGP